MTTGTAYKQNERKCKNWRMWQDKGTVALVEHIMVNRTSKTIIENLLLCSRWWIWKSEMIDWMITVNQNENVITRKSQHVSTVANGDYFSVPDPIDIIWKRQFNLLGKFAHMDPTCLPHKFLTTWVSHPRCSGGQHYTLQNSYVKTLQHILPNIPDNGTIDSWLPLVQNHEQWKTLGTEWIKHWQALTIYQYGPHPLLGDGILDHQFLWYVQDIHHRFSMKVPPPPSMFFYYVMVLLLFWGHKPCIGFFLWQFNTPDALICYTGSIEKLKLLGATCLPTYLMEIFTDINNI
jgi:hypothetical protein